MASRTRKKAGTFPGESSNYRRARNRLLKAEIKLRRQVEAVASQRRRLPLGGQVKTDYVIDAIDGAARHVVQRMNFAVIAKAPIAQFREHADRRGWRHALLLSSEHNTFNRDYHAEDDTGQQWPLAHVFVRRGRKMHHFWSSELWFTEQERGQDRRHVDFMWPMWAMLDRTPEGRGKDWGPLLEYR